MKLELTAREARVLERALEVHLAEMTRELVRTDKHELQRVLGERTELLEGVWRRLRDALPNEDRPPSHA